MNPYKRYCEIVKSRHSIESGKYGTHDDPIEVAHLRIMPSDKLEGMMPRSHKTRARWAAIPLLRSEHQRLHEIGESVWLELWSGGVPAEINEEIIRNMGQLLEEMQEEDET